MATFDQLSAEQRAIIELVLKQGKSYDELGTMLGMPTSRVRDLAREALVKLSPVSAAAVDADWRGQLSDYLLNQQTGPEGTATKGHLRRSEGARAWARSVLDSLEQFYGTSEIPVVPDGDPAAAPRRERKPKREPKTKTERAPRQSRGRSFPPLPSPLVLGSAVALVLVLFVVLVWPVGVLTGSDDDSSAAKPAKTATQAKILGQLQLKAVQPGSKAAGLAVIVQRGNTRQLVVEAQLTPVKSKQAYEVWLYNSRNDAKSLGAQVTDQNGTLQGAATLPGDLSKYRYIDVSLETIDKNPKHSATSVLRGRIDQIQAPAAANQQQGTAPQTTAPQTTTPGQ